MVQISRDFAPIWDRTTDVVVVGSGASAFASAVTAAYAGAEVVMLEKDGQVGGTTAKSGGGMWIPNNPVQRKAGISDSHVDAVAYIARLADPQRYNPRSKTLGLSPDQFELIEVFCNRATEAVEALMAIGALYLKAEEQDGSPVPLLPDYQADLPENRSIVGRTVSPTWDFDEETPPEFQAKSTEPNPGGMILIEMMRRAAVRRDVDIRLNTRVTDVVVDEDERVVGVMARVGRRAELIATRKAVVFGSGGFLMNPDLTHEFLRGHVYGGCAVPTNEGDLLAIANRLGVELGNMTNAWWDQVVLEVALQNRSTAQDIWFPFGDSMIQVNKYGHRVGNEKELYNERSQVHFVWDPCCREYSNALLFQIWDEAVASDPRQTRLRGFVPLPDEPANYVVSAPTLTELAAKIDRRLQDLAEVIGDIRLDKSFDYNLRATIERYNSFANSGVDLDFKRGMSPIQQVWQGPGRPGSPNPCMAPISDQGPYHAMIVGAGALDTKGGPKTNSKAQLLRSAGTPVPGLYGAGNCVASPFGQAYPGAGGTIGPAVTFGYIAGLNAASEVSVEL